MNTRVTALIADDEPLLRDALRRELAKAWPELEVVAEARNGREAVTLFDERQPDICFLDVHMPGLSGVDAANHIGRRAHVVFVTAYDHYAVQAFAQGALDYLLKPVEPARLADTVNRLRERLQSSRPAINTEQLLQQLSEQLAKLQGGEVAGRRRRARGAAMDSRASGQHRASHRDRRCRFSAVRREVHDRRLARRRQTGRGSGADAVEGTGGAA
jgi:DNA-binding LytR/AlgR family response regulator